MLEVRDIRKSFDGFLAVGALALIWLNQQIVSYTQYWPLILGSILVILLFVFPGGLAGAVIALWRRLQRRPAGA